MNILKEIYKEDHLGVSVIREALNPIEVAKIFNTLTSQKNRYKPLPFGSVARWDFSTDDLQRFTSLSRTLEIFSNISDRISNVTKNNPVFETKLCSMFYPTGSSGVEPHRDSIHSVNSVLIFVLSGNNKFYATRSFDDTKEIEFHIQPGDAILIRGPRNTHDHLSRPIHYVKKVKSPRYVIVCRQINLEKIDPLADRPRKLI